MTDAIAVVLGIQERLWAGAIFRYMLIVCCSMLQHISFYGSPMKMGFQFF